jgi:DNA-binding beta-propeller fold protein YncE
MVFAPSGDQTDDPNQFHLYIADRGSLPVEQTIPDPALLPNKLYLPLIIQATQQAGTGTGIANGELEVVGKVVEIALNQVWAEVQAAASTTQLSLVRTIDSSKWSPPSPDPSGITYNPATNRLIISDGEVDEISSLFTGKNVFYASLTGAPQGTMSTMPASREPTGVSYNPTNGYLFYSDDDKRRIFEVNPGADRILGTGDDSITSFSVTPFGGRDPEDLAYEVAQNRLWIIDGLNAEVYRLLPGANNRFDGVPPDGDDILTQFDTYKLNIRDPEGIYPDPATGNLILTCLR